MSDNKVFARRLTQLEAILTNNVKDSEYDHHSWSTCALGAAMRHRNIFRGLNLKLDGFPMCGLVHDDDSTVMKISETVDGYFGPGAFSNVFGSFAPYPGDGSRREGVIITIQQFRDNLLAEAA